MKTLALVLAALLALAPVAARAEKPLGPEEITSVDEVAVAIASYFPRAQGEVKAVQGDRLTLSIGRKEGLLPGMVLSLWREGREFQHPVTKAVLGHVEESVGTVEVTAVAEGSSTAVPKTRQKDPKIGDRARISPRPLGIAVIPVGAERPEILQGLLDRLKELGRFQVQDAQTTAQSLKGRPQRDASAARDLIAAGKLDAVAALGTYPVGDKLLLTVRIFYAGEADPVDTYVAMLTLASKREALGDVRPYFAPVAPAQEKLADLPAAARRFAVDDLEVDGVQEYVFTDESRLHIYRSDASGWKEVWTETVPPAEREGRQVHVDVLDVNGNGRPEIFVTRMLSGRVSSLVFEFRDGAFRRIAEVPGFLRVLRMPGRGRVLIGQDYDPDIFYSGPVREMTWSGGAYAPGATIALPKGIGFFDFAFANLGDGRPSLVAFDGDYHVTVYSGMTVIWKSEEAYLAVDTVVQRPATGLDAALGRTPTDLDRAVDGQSAQRRKDREVRIPGGILTADLDGNGRDEIIVPKNSTALLTGGYKNGELHILEWNGNRLEPRWSVRDLDGAVLDAQLLTPSGNAGRIAALVRVPGGLFSKDTVRVELYSGK